MHAHPPPTPFLRRWFLAVTASVIVGVTFGFVMWFFLPPYPQLAFTKLQIHVKPAGVLQQHPEGQVDFHSFLKTQVALIKSRALLENALARPEIANIRPSLSKKPEELLARNLKVDFPDSQETIRVSLQRPTELEAKLLVQAITDSYLSAFADMQMHQRNQRLRELQVIHETKRKELEAVDNRIAKLEDLAAKRELKRMLELECERETREQVLATVKKVFVEIENLKKELNDPVRVMLLQPATIVRVEDFPRRLTLSLLAGLVALAATMSCFALLRAQTAHGFPPIPF